MKTREPEDEHCVLWCTFICNTLPLDNSKTYSHPALLYITWGLIWDSKIKKKESLGLKFSTGQASGILKLRQEEEILIENFHKLLVSQIQTAEEGFEEKVSISQERDNTVTSFQESSNSNVWDELKFVRVNLIDLSHRGQIKRKTTTKRGNVTYRGYKAR